MEFAGRVYFEAGSADTWHLYRFLAATVAAGADLRLSWVPFLAREDRTELRALAAFAIVKQEATDRHGAFLQALLQARHGEGKSLADDATYLEAADAAGVASGLVVATQPGEDAVRVATKEASGLGVVRTPSIYRHGPVLRVRVNPAALDGDVIARLRVIDAVLGDDGVWALEKP